VTRPLWVLAITFMIALAGYNLFEERVIRNKQSAVIFACGFVAGQRDIAHKARLDSAAPEMPDWCKPIRDNAVANGFTSAIEGDPL
jgi:hypothetical protein